MPSPPYSARTDEVRVLIVGIDWHGDVAHALASGVTELGARAFVLYALRQRRTGVLPRVTDELLATRTVGPRLRAEQRRRARAHIATALERVRPTSVICLSPETLDADVIELLLRRTPVVSWWFADDPLDLSRRALRQSPAILSYVQALPSCAFVSHPAWARGPLLGAEYLPYASRFSPSRPAVVDRRKTLHECVVIGSPRPERARLLEELSRALNGKLNVWGWGTRGRLGLNPSARGFRTVLRGGRALTQDQTEGIYRSARVVLNLQDSQMLGAWNPQTFDVMGLGLPQIVWNRQPVGILDSPPPFSDTAPGLAQLVLDQLDRAETPTSVLAGFHEIRDRHRWMHRAERLLKASL